MPRKFLFAVALVLAVLIVNGVSCSATNGSGFGGAGGTPASSSSGPGNAGAGGGLELDGGGAGGSSGTGGDPVNCAQAATSKTYIGCEFWPTVVANNVWSIFDYAVVVANAGMTPANVTVSRGAQQVVTSTIAPGQLGTIYLPWVSELKGPDANSCGGATPLLNTVRVADGAYHLVSSSPVTVYQFNALEYRDQGGPPGKDWSSCPGATCPNPLSCFSYSNDASLLLPATALTGNYRISGVPGWALANISGYFAVTGTQNNTQVTVSVAPGGAIQGGGGIAATPGGGILKFALNAGEVVEVLGTPTTDLSGSLVQADKPVQVIFGVPCIQTPIGTQACDHIEESVFPAETLGKHYFVTVPTGPNATAVGHVVRIYGNVDGTKLTYPAGAAPGAPGAINAGQVVDMGVVTQDFEMKGDHEFGVSSFQLGGALVDPNAMVGMQRGDPSQSNMTAVEQYRLRYIFLAPSDYDVSFVDVIMPTAAALILDGAALKPPLTPISSGFGVARVPLGPGKGGAHELIATAPVGIQVMGYGQYTSYQYPGGLNLGAIAPPPPPPAK